MSKRDQRSSEWNVNGPLQKKNYANGPRGWIKDDPGGKFEEGKRRALIKPEPTETETKKPLSTHAQSPAKNAH